MPRPDWLDTEAYPFEANWFDADPGTVHYVDEGEGHPVVFLHGNPSWSFLYRRPVSALSDDYRCIAPDFLGFGLSDKPADWGYTAREHTEVLTDLLDDLDLTDATLVVHDWGGPIGWRFAIDSPERVSSLVVSNSFCWPPEDWWTKSFSLAVGGPVGRYACREHNAFTRWVMPLAFADRSALRPVHDQYLSPLADRTDRIGSGVFPRELRTAREWLAEGWERRAELADLPATIVWGKRDPAFRTRYRRRWEALFPTAEIVAFDDVGHYVPEEGGQRYVDALVAFLAGLG